MRRSHEIPYPAPWPGVLMLVLAIVLLVAAIAAFAVAGAHQKPIFGVLGLLLAILSVLVFVGLTLVNPNHAKVVLLFGKYRGTLREPGFYWVHPFTVRRKVSLRVHNFSSETLKVNDRRGNPIEIGAIVVWRVRDTAQALFDVEDHVDYVRVQSESALRHLAALHPYDMGEEGEVTLRSGTEEVNAELKRELTERLALSGIEVLEARLSHLAYAPEIAGAMLQRQQAEAIIAARTRIVDGAVGMVRMALESLKEQGVVDLDEERKATMVGNLLVVLCSERAATPVLNTAGLYA